MSQTRLVDLAWVAGGLALLAWLAMTTAYSTLPAIPVLAGSSLFIAAAADILLGFVIRFKVGKDEVGLDRRQLNPVTAARCVVLAKASAWLGAGAFGVWLGLLVFLTPRRAELVHAEADWPGALIGAVAAASLVGAALWLEYCCRAPEDSGNSKPT